MKFFGALFIVSFAAFDFQPGHSSTPPIQPSPPTEPPTALEQINNTIFNSVKRFFSAVNPMDCSDIVIGEIKSGVYTIFPFIDQPEKAINVFCDMETDGGEWTVFLNRFDEIKRVNFTRTWDEYKEFFGNPDGEFWIGNENLHALTSNRNYAVKWQARTLTGERIWAEHNSFSVDSEANNYKLTLGGYNEKSTGFDSEGFGYNNGQKFTTLDKDNDLWGSANCAYTGGWWFKNCTCLYPTNIYGNFKPEGLVIVAGSKQNPGTTFADWFRFMIRPTT